MLVPLIVALGCLVAIALVTLVIFTALASRAAEHAVPRCGRVIVVDGVELHYREEGIADGAGKPTIVMIHGLASQLQSYTYALDRLLSERYRVVMIDRPGCGYSQAAPSDGFATQAALIDKAMGKLGIERALVVGHSLGGAIALTLALEHPQRVAGLALLAPVTQPQERAPAALKGLQITSDAMRWLIGWTLAAPMGIAKREATAAALFGPDPAPLDFGTRGGGVLALRPRAFRAACRDLACARDDLPTLHRRYGELAIPVGILFGDGDRILDATLHGHGMLKAVPTLKLEIIAGGGHMVPLSHPERTAAFVETMAAASGMSPGGEAGHRSAYMPA